MPVAALAAPPTTSGGGLFTLADPRIAESSGLVLSRRHPHVVWTANDSGDSARIFAVDTRTGRTVGVHRFGAPVRDVEALTMTRDGRLLVGDIGDNGASRSSVRVYRFEEPALGETSGPASSWDLRYPDGPHDAESLAVDPATGRVLVVTKGPTGGVYALPAHPSRTGVNRLTMVGPAPAVATDAVFLADGSALAVRTYLALFLLDPREFHRLASAPLPVQPQGETLALAQDGHGLLVGSEGLHSVVREVPVPQVAAGATPAPTTTSGRPSGAPGATAAGTPARPAEPSARAAARRPPQSDGTAELVAGVVAAAVGLGLLAWGLGHLTRRGTDR
jgi:hypothetical protein